MGLADSPVAAQTYKSACEDMAQAAKVGSSGDQEFSLRTTSDRKIPRKFSMVEAGDRIGRR